MGEEYSEIYESACHRFGVDNVTDKTYDEYPRGDRWRPLDEGLQKFEVDIRDSDVTAEELREILNEYGYQVWMKGDGRFKSGTCPYKYVAVVTQESEPIDY